MITQLEGKIAEITDTAVTLNVGGIYYEISALKSVLDRLSSAAPDATAKLVIYHYVQTDPSKAVPMLLGFNNRVEKDFFTRFISVAGVGPKAALRALNVPISQIAQAIDAGDVAFLKTLPGVGEQRAREIIAKLQGKVGRFGLIQDGAAAVARPKREAFEDEALSILIQLQYKKEEARRMVDEAVRRNPKIKNAEDLLNEVYYQRGDKAAVS